MFTKKSFYIPAFVLLVFICAAVWIDRYVDSEVFVGSKGGQNKDLQGVKSEWMTMAEESYAPDVSVKTQKSENPKSELSFVTFPLDFQEVKVLPGVSFYGIFRAKVDGGSYLELKNSIKEIRSPAKLSLGDRFYLYFSNHNQEDELIRVDWIFNEKSVLITQLNDQGKWESNLHLHELETRTELISGVISTSLWESFAEQKVSTKVTAQFANIFAWDIDFSRQVRRGDTWRFLVEKIYPEGKKSYYGRILAASYSRGNEVSSAVYWDAEESPAESGYYRPDGSSMRKMFLKAPVEFSRISSKFNKRRFHPILKVHKPHYGVDYAAKIGTPVMTIGDGTVVYKGYSRTAGKTIKIRHGSTYTTAYKHLHTYGKGIKVGAKVTQGQKIGTVGQTGLATGPHLHFELKKNGKITDPLSEDFPSADPVPRELKPLFLSQTKMLRETFIR